MNRISVQFPNPEPVVHRSLGLEALLQQMQPDQRYTILDLGSAFGVNVEFFSQFPCKIYIEELYRSLASSPAFYSELADSSEKLEEDPSEKQLEDSSEKLFEKLLPYPMDTRFDVILTWDVFNYLAREQLVGLVRHLSRFCRPGTFLFSLISILPEIPDQPTSFKILDRERLLYENSSPVSKPCPRYQPRDVNKIMVGFRVSNSFLMRHGIQEYLFVYEGATP